MQKKQKWRIKNGWSFLTIIVFVLSVNTVINSHGIPIKPHSLCHYDQAGYYSYMPATFIYHDYSFSFYDSLGYNRQDFMKPHEGQLLNKYHVGPAILATPFYLIGHLEAGWTGEEQNGFSTPYKHWVLLGCLFYVAFGMFLVRSMLLAHFSDVEVALTLLIIGLGANLLYYTTNEGMMSHGYSFFLFAATLFATRKFLKTEHPVWILLTGLLSGLIIVTRIPNILFLIVPVLWGVDSWDALKERGQFLWQKKWWLLPAMLLAAIAFLPQMLYWKTMFDTWFLHAYSGERFFFDQPLIGRILFSYRKGWLVYSPLMALSLIGFIWLRKYARPAFWPILIFFSFNLYLISCWGAWWYGGGFSMRTLVESYAVLSFPLAACIKKVLEIGWSRYVFTALLPLFIYFNLVMTHQYSFGIIHHEAMTKKAFWAVFGYYHPAHGKVGGKRNRALDYPDPWKANEDRVYRGKLR
jgi:hypothetical protein